MTDAETSKMNIILFILIVAIRIIVWAVICKQNFWLAVLCEKENKDLVWFFVWFTLIWGGIWWW